MPALASDLRRQLEHVIIQARDVAEAAASAALKRLAVDATRPFDHFSEAQRQLRIRLRARARQAGDQRKPNGEQEIEQLTQELAYEYWHRMLFARFLAENNLLMHPDGVAVSLADCEELAQVEGAENGWIMAARYASRMLPQIFRTDDVLLEIEFPINDRLPLEKLLASLPPETFTADDSLGWVYQFWQSKKKEEVNRSGAKIDGHTLPAVTQLFTEPYMVKLLLHNTIGAWWCAQHGMKGPSIGAGVPAGQAPVEMEYLRWRDDGTPAAGSFDGWPKTLKEFTMLDPCCGSGHFLVEAFRLVVPLRMHDEELSAREACDVVLSENLFGLELDPRCTQIAAFALALAAWKYPDESSQQLGYRPLPPLNVACSGLSVTGKKEEWLSLANGDSRLLEGMVKLYDLFRQAPHLGSLIDPRGEVGDLITAGYAELQPLLEKVLVKERIQKDVEAVAVGIAAHGIAKAAELLSRAYSLIATNVPYLGRSAQHSILVDWADRHSKDARADLATMFLSRGINLLAKDGTIAIVSPQNWLFLTSYRKFRERLLSKYSWNFIAKLGERDFESPSAAGAFVSLLILTNCTPDNRAEMAGLDASGLLTPAEKAKLLGGVLETDGSQKAGLRHYSSGKINTSIHFLVQADQRRNPDSVVVTEPLAHTTLLSDYAFSVEGLSTGDGDRYVRCFWEMPERTQDWEFFQGSPPETTPYGGRECILFWECGKGSLQESDGARVQGHLAWGKDGVIVGQMRVLKCALYSGHIHEKITAAIIPKNDHHLPAIWAFCSSPKYNDSVRAINQKLSVATGTLTKVPFDLSHWKAVGEKTFPNGLPKPYSDDPTQWTFMGDITITTDPLQVAVARLLGYRWPEQSKEQGAIEALADRDGIICVTAVRAERPAAERLLDILRTPYGSQWSDAILHRMLMDAGCSPAMSLNDWLRDKFFEQHCKRFHHRPFIWHIWDGRKDGFSCLVNYHKHTHQRLETLTYAYLQDWITAQAAAARDAKPGADLRLAVAQELQNKLKLILEGEPPYDIFVRWKPIHEQPIGWNPDLNDGVRVNIRPLIMANVLRKLPNITWSKDRGKEPERAQAQFPWLWKNGAFTGDRINDVHLTNAQKRAAREKAGHG